MDEKCPKGRGGFQFPNTSMGPCKAEPARRRCRCLRWLTTPGGVPGCAPRRGVSGGSVSSVVTLIRDSLSGPAACWPESPKFVTGLAFAKLPFHAQAEVERGPPVPGHLLPAVGPRNADHLLRR